MKKFDTDVLELILFSVGNELLAIETSHLLEVLEATHVSPIPFVPPYIDGLINVNGQIMPQINFSVLTEGQLDSEIDDQQESSTLLVVSVDGMLMALLVGAVQEPISAKITEIKAVKSKSAKGKGKKSKTADTKVSEECFFGQVTHADQSVKIFDVEALKGIIKSSEQSAGKKGFLGKATKETEEIEVVIDYLFIKVMEREYAINLNDVVEITELETVSRQPRAPEIVAGVGLIRSEPRLIVSLSNLLNNAADNRTDGAVVIVENNDVQCGLLIGELVGLESVKQSQLRVGNDEQDVTIIGENGDKLIKVLHMAKLFNDETMSKILPYMPDIKQSVQEIKLKQFEILQFMVDGDAFGFFIDDVRRVLSGKSLERLLTEHKFIMGTMELEGKVIPVINLLAQLGYSELGSALDEDDVQREYIVVNDGHSDWGLAISQTEQIIQVDETKVEKVTSDSSSFVSSFVNYNEQLITILNPEAICIENKEHEAEKA